MAKTAKAFMVLVKRKLGRDQTCRSKPFRSLMALVFDKDMGAPDSLCMGCWAFLN